MLERIYRLFHRLASPPGEREEYSRGYWQHRIRQEALKLCAGLNEGKVLEVGCGEGIFLNQLAAQNPCLEIWGVDNNADRLKKAEERRRNKKVNLSLQDASALSFDNEFFDAIVCINVFFNMDSLKSVERALGEMKRSCKKAGRIIFEFRNSANSLLKIKYKLARYYDGTVNDIHLNTYDLAQIEEILNNLGMSITRKKFVGFPIRQIAPVIMIEAKKR